MISLISSKKLRPVCLRWCKMMIGNGSIALQLSSHTSTNRCSRFISYNCNCGLCFESIDGDPLLHYQKMSVFYFQQRYWCCKCFKFNAQRQLHGGGSISTRLVLEWWWSALPPFFTWMWGSPLTIAYNPQSMGLENEVLCMYSHASDFCMDSTRPPQYAPLTLSK